MRCTLKYVFRESKPSKKVLASKMSSVLTSHDYLLPSHDYLLPSHDYLLPSHD
jgi:hypothetical protein